MKTFLLPLLLFAGTSFSQNWITTSPVPALGRDDAIAFSLDGYGFLVTGNQSGFTESNRLWRYDQVSDSWTEKTPFPGEARQYAGSFVLNNEAYIIMGISANSVPLNDVWKYNAQMDSWKRLHDFPGAARWSMFTFSTPIAGYAGTGSTLSALLSDCWRYDPITDSWTQLADFPGGTRRETVSFSIGEKGFAGLGYAVLGGSDFRNDFYEWNELTGLWTQLTDFSEARSYGVAIGTDAYGYVGTGQDENGSFNADCFRFDPSARMWLPVADLSTIGIKGMSAFAIDDTPYFVTGITEDFIRVSSCWKLENAPASDPFFACYPNPSNGTMVVKAKNGSHIQLFASDGKCVFETTVEEQQTVFLQAVPAGAYQLKVVTSNKIFHQGVLVY